MPTIQIKTPKKFDQRQRELGDFIKKHNPILILEKLTARKVKSNILVHHKPVGFAADWEGNNIYVDFNNKVIHLWFSICHELAHVILRNPPWYENKEIKQIIGKHKERISKYKYSFQYAIEQTLAVLLQASCGRGIDKRPKWPEWKTWELNFKCLGVKEIGKKLWPDWLKYLKNILKYKNIDEWILGELEKHYSE